MIKINHQTCERIKNFRQRTFQHNQNALNAIMPHAKFWRLCRQGMLMPPSIICTAIWSWWHRI